MKYSICVIIFLICLFACGKKQRTVNPIVTLQEQINNESQKLKTDTTFVKNKDSIGK